MKFLRIILPEDYVLIPVDKIQFIKTACEDESGFYIIINTDIGTWTENFGNEESEMLDRLYKIQELLNDEK